MSTKRKTHSRNTKTILFERTKKTTNPVIRVDRKGNFIHKDYYGERNHLYGWDIHHIDLNYRNNEINNLEALNYSSHKEVHDED